MKDRKLLTRVLAGMLAVFLLIGLLPLIASADEVVPNAEVGENASLDNLHLNKTAVLQDDGTWTITLEAYATGTVKGVVTKQVTPTDIILVLDQSGSMEQKNMTVAGSFGKAGNVTNESLLSGNGQYYYYDYRDDKYYPVTTTKQIAVQDSYWYALSYENGSEVLGDQICLSSAANGIVGTSWDASQWNTVYFDSGYGYLLKDYLIYKSTRVGNGNNRTYGYELQDHGSDYAGNLADYQTPVSGQSSRQAAWDELVAKFPGRQIGFESYWGSENYYAIVYTPVKLVDNSTYYYTYTYTDDQGQLWTIGHSAQFTGSNDVVSGAYYDAAALGDLYTTSADRTVSRLVALRESANAFISNISSAALTHNVNHRIAVVGFSGNDVERDGYEEYQYINSELFVGANQYNYWGSGNNAASAHYSEAFQDVRTQAGLNNLTASIGALEGNGPTYPSSGMYLAQGVAQANGIVDNVNLYTSGQRKLVIVFMTDGEPGWNGFEDGEASKTLTALNELKTTYGATVYTMAVMDDDEIGGDERDFLNSSSSNGTYTLASTGVDLSNFFNIVEDEVQSTTADVMLTQSAFMVDRLSQYFNMPAGVTQENLADYITVQKAQHVGNHEFLTPVDVPFTVDGSASDPENDGKVHVWLTYDATGTVPHGISVHNWDFVSEENLVTTTTNGGEVQANGYKLIVTIRGVTAKDSAAIDGYIPTNDEHSGIWDQALDSNGQPTGQYGKLKAFPVPVTNIVNRTYVLDYGMTSLLEATSNIRKALALDSAQDKVFSPVTYTPGENGNVYDAIQLSHPALAYGDASVNTGDQKIYYTPKTTNWNGYDSFYVFWTSGQTGPENTGIGDVVTGNGWSKINVIPANNVYYEDSFITTSTDGSTETGRVGIVYTAGKDPNSGEDISWGQEGTSDGNQEIHEGNVNADGITDSVHGWINSLSDDNTFSDGSAHFIASVNGQASFYQKDENGEYVKDDDGNYVLVEELAKASFTFTGTGVDIYSRTNNTTGTILVQVDDISEYVDGKRTVVATKTETTYLSEDNEQIEGAKKVVTITTTTAEISKLPTHYLIVDNKAASGDYYQVPTVSFMPSHTMAITTQVTTITYAADGTEESRVEGEPVTENVVEPAHGTYRVTITVTTGAAAEGRFTYYLDGIRVYNPLDQSHENDPNVDSAYGSESDAIFKEVRQMLIDANSFGEAGGTGFVFIDEISVDAEQPEETPEETEPTEPSEPEEPAAPVVYLDPGDFWPSDNARFAVYLWNSSGNTWVDMADTDGDGYYEATLPEGYSNLIFCRMKPSVSANDWSNKWNQTGDLTLPADGMNCYTIPTNNDAWNSDALNNTRWSTYTPAVEEEPTEPTEPEVTEPTTGVGVVTNQISVFEAYGPENEVYLKPGQAIAFKVDEKTTRVMVGLKTLDGTPTTANVSYFDTVAGAAQGAILVDHTTDLYYELYPNADGYVIIKNAGNGILSITKAKFLSKGAAETTPHLLPSGDAAQVLSAVDSFDSLPVMTYVARTNAPAEPPVVQQPQTPDVDISNPSDSTTEDTTKNQLQELVDGLFTSVRTWFHA